jgi:hypothetical protein
VLWDRYDEGEKVELTDGKRTQIRRFPFRRTWLAPPSPNLDNIFHMSEHLTRKTSLGEEFFLPTFCGAWETWRYGRMVTCAKNC